jgi:urease accessory protein
MRSVSVCLDATAPFEPKARRQPAAASPGDGWKARLELAFDAGPERTVLRHRRHVGPLRVQRAFHPEGAPCHTYLLHPPGGVVGGDQLEIDVRVAPGAHALLTTPAAAKFYRSAGPLARQHQAFRVEAGAVLEWLPALSILHGGARVELRSRFELGPGASLLAWDLLGLGRPGSGDGFRTGSCDAGLQVVAGGRPLLLERLRLEGGTRLLAAPWGLHGRGYAATMIASPATPEMRETLRGALQASRGTIFGCTLLPASGVRVPGDPVTGLLVCRWLAESGEGLWESLLQAWSLLRPLVLGRAPCPPRIWST